MAKVEVVDGHVVVHLNKEDILETGFNPMHMADLYPGIPIMNKTVVVIRLPSDEALVNIYYHNGQTMQCVQTTNAELIALKPLVTA